jgi:hypothetical protein
MAAVRVVLVMPPSEVLVEAVVLPVLLSVSVGLAVLHHQTAAEPAAVGVVLVAPVLLA